MSRERLLLVIPVGAAALLSFWIYAPAFDSYLIDDDFQWIDGAMQLGAGHAFVVSGRTHFYRPLVEVYFALMYDAFGCSAAALHVASVFLHIVNAYLVMVLAWRLTRATSVAAIAGVLFAAQQAPAQAVLWPSAVSALLCATFGLLMLIADTCRPRRGNWITAAVALAYAGALAAHESGVMWLAAAVLVRYGQGEPLNARGLVRDYWPSLLLAAGYLTLTAWINAHNYVVTEGQYRPGLHVFSNLFAYLTALYAGHRRVMEYVAVGALAAIALWRGPRRVRAWCIWLLAALLPVLAFTTPPASRYVYIPAIPFCLLVATAIAGIAQAAGRFGMRHRRALVLATAAVLTTFVAGRSALFARKGAEGFRNDAARYERVAQQMQASDAATRTINRAGIDWIDPQYLPPLMRVATCDPRATF